MIVPPDGPVPCDLAVVGESPGREEAALGRSFVGPAGRVLWARDGIGLDLMVTMAQRPRETVYVSNVCKIPLPEDRWIKLSQTERDTYSEEIRAELIAVEPKLVISVGSRASKVLIPGFDKISAEHGKAKLGHGGKYLVLPIWHPAAYLRGNSDALGMIMEDLVKVQDLLLDGLVDLVQPFPEIVEEPKTWPEAIGFLSLSTKIPKTGRCFYCGKGEARLYSGDGLKWRLCLRDAVIASEWAKSNAHHLKRHQEIAVADALLKKQERAADRMQDALCE